MGVNFFKGHYSGLGLRTRALFVYKRHTWTGDKLESISGRRLFKFFYLFCTMRRGEATPSPTLPSISIQCRPCHSRKRFPAESFNDTRSTSCSLEIQIWKFELFWIGILLNFDNFLILLFVLLTIYSRIFLNRGWANPLTLLTASYMLIQAYLIYC